MISIGAKIKISTGFFFGPRCHCDLSAAVRRFPKKKSGKKRKFRVGRNIWIGGGDTVSFGLFSFFILLFGPNPIFSFFYIRGGRRRMEKGQRHCDQKQSFPTHALSRKKKRLKEKRAQRKGKCGAFVRPRSEKNLEEIRGSDGRRGKHFLFPSLQFREWLDRKNPLEKENFVFILFRSDVRALYDFFLTRFPSKSDEKKSSPRISSSFFFFFLSLYDPCSQRTHGRVRPPEKKTWRRVKKDVLSVVSFLVVAAVEFYGGIFSPRFFFPLANNKRAPEKQGIYKSFGKGGKDEAAIKQK